MGISHVHPCDLRCSNARVWVLGSLDPTVPFTDGVWQAPQAASRERPGCVWFEAAHECISKHYLLPILKCLSASFPDAMYGFYSYGHSEYINRRWPCYGERAWQDPPSRACGAATTTA